MEAMIAAEGRKNRARKGGEIEAVGKRPAVKVPSPNEAKAFLTAAAACEEKKQESVGMGWHFRYSGKKMVGSGLAVEEKIVHVVFFRFEEAENWNPKAKIRKTPV